MQLLHGFEPFFVEFSTESSLKPVPRSAAVWSLGVGGTEELSLLLRSISERLSAADCLEMRGKGLVPGVH